MERPETAGFRKPIDSGKRVEVGLAVITYGVVGDRGYASCSCGQPFTQRRTKVREDAIDKHLNEKHAGRGIRL